MDVQPQAEKEARKRMGDVSVNLEGFTNGVDAKREKTSVGTTDAAVQIPGHPPFIELLLEPRGLARFCSRNPPTVS